MEHRVELEQILLAGLPEQERKETVQSIQRATSAKLDHLRSLRDPNAHGVNEPVEYEVS